MHALRTLLLSASIIIGAGSSQASSRRGGVPVEVTAERTVFVRGPILSGNILPLGEKLVRWTETDATQPVTIVIDSPGGELTTGFRFAKYLDAVRARGGTVRCIVRDMAASLAFQLFTKCDERYALSSSLLLWHRVRIGIQAIMTAPLASKLLGLLAAFDEEIYGELQLALPGIPDDMLSYHFEEETLHRAVEVAAMDKKFMTVLPYIPGLITLEDRKVPTSAMPSRGIFDILRGGFIYAKKEVLDNWNASHE